MPVIVIHPHNPLLHQPFHIPFPTLQISFIFYIPPTRTKPAGHFICPSNTKVVHRLTFHFLRNKPSNLYCTTPFWFHKEMGLPPSITKFTNLPVQKGFTPASKGPLLITVLLLPVREGPRLNLGPRDPQF